MLYFLLSSVVKDLINFATGAPPKVVCCILQWEFSSSFSRALMICRFRKSKPLLSLSNASFILFMQNFKILKYKEAISCEGSVGLAFINENFLISHTCIRIRKLFSFGYYSQGTFSLCNILFWYGVGLEIMLFKKIYIFIWFCFQVFYYSMFL